MPQANRRIVISGCSGGGKSTLLTALAVRGYPIVEEPGRRIVREELAKNGQALPWVDMAAFARRAFDLALADHCAAEPAWTFFDRSWIDAASTIDHLTGGTTAARFGRDHRYHPIVFLVPPWPEIFTADAERPHGFDQAVTEYERLCESYHALGYQLAILPRADVETRIATLLGRLGI